MQNGIIISSNFHGDGDNPKRNISHLQLCAKYPSALNCPLLSPLSLKLSPFSIFFPNSIQLIARKEDQKGKWGEEGDHRR